MKALLIDPYKQTITEVEHLDDYKDIQKHIRAAMFDHVRIGENEGVYIADDGLLTANTSTRFFMLSNWRYPLAGYGLVLGSDKYGESVSTQFTIDDLEQDIVWVSAFEALQYPEIRPILQESLTIGQI